MSDVTTPSGPCPQCGRTIKSAATLCGYCWTRIPPVDADGNVLGSWVPPAAHRPWWKFWG